MPEQRGAASLAESVCVVIGASAGIGASTCRALRERGATVVGVARGRERLESLGEEIGLEARAGDATDMGAIDAIVGEAVERHGRVDALVNCVGSAMLKPAHLVGEGEWAEAIAQNLTSAFGVVRAAGKHMRSGGGSVVLLSAAVGQTGVPNHEVIGATKAGVAGLARSAASTYAPRGIRFNAVAPGMIETDLTAPFRASEASRKASVAMHPLGRLGRPEEVASLILWLVDPANAWVTGQVIEIDGGLASIRGRATA